MASPVRLNEELMRDAEMESRLNKRSLPKQIEYWAELGKKLEGIIKPDEIIAINQGLAKLEVTSTDTVPIDTDEVFASLSMDRRDGSLSKRVTSSNISYEISDANPGLLLQIDQSGNRRLGRFVNGEFIPS